VLDDALDHLDALSIAGDHAGARRALLDLAAPATAVGRMPEPLDDRSSAPTH